MGSDGDTFKFSANTITSDSVSGSPSELEVTGTGTITATGPVSFSPTPGTWVFTTYAASGGVFSFSAAPGAPVPDGGATMLLLGIALLGAALLKKKLPA